jgi:hypothetical protein
LATYRDRFSRKNILAIFVACAFPIHIWAVIGMLNQIPAWLTRSGKLGDLSGLISLTLLFTLLESLIVTLIVVLLFSLIPVRWFNEKIIIYGVIVVWLAAVASMVGHLAGSSIRSSWALLIPVGYLVLVVATLWSAHRFQKFGNGISRLLDRLTILTFFYLFFDFLAVVVVLLRNF